MAVPNILVTLSGTSYPIPQVGSSPWGQNVTNWIVAASGSTGFVQLGGGNQPLAADLNFGASFGIISIYFKSRSSNIASAGVVRLANGDTIDWRNFGNTADDSLFPGVATNSQSADDLYYKNGTTSVTTQLTGNPYLEVNTSAQSIPSGAVTTVILTTKVTDTDSAYSVSTGLFTVPANKGGVYLVSCSWEINTAPAAQAEYSIFVQVNGSTVAGQRLSVGTPVASSIEGPSVATLVNVVPGNTINFSAYQTSGGARSLDSTANGNRLTIKRIS